MKSVSREDREDFEDVSARKRSKVAQSPAANTLRANLSQALKNLSGLCVKRKQEDQVTETP